MTKLEKAERLALHYAEQITELEKTLEQEKKLNAEIKARFVKCNTCTDEMKSKCLMFSENLCEGERCEELVDLMALVSKSDLQKENEQLKDQIADIKANCDLAIEGRDIKIKKLEQENAELKERLELLNLNANIAVRDLNDLLTKAKEIIKDLLEYSKEHWLYSDIKKQAEQFLKENGGEK